MEGSKDDDSSSLPSMLRIESRRTPQQNEQGCSSDSADLRRVCHDHIIPQSADGYIDSVKDSTEKMPSGATASQNPAAPTQKMDDENVIKTIQGTESSKRRSKGLSRVARVIVSKFVRSSSKKSDRQISKDVDSESSSDNTDSPSLQRGRSKSLSGRILRRFRNQSRDRLRDADGSDSQNSTSKRRQSHHDATQKSGSERTCSKSRKYRPLIKFAEFDPREYPTENEEDIQSAIREREIKEGVEPTPQYLQDDDSSISEGEDSDYISASLETWTCAGQSKTKSAATVKDTSAVAPYPQLSSVVPDDIKDQFDKDTGAASNRGASPVNAYMTPHVHTKVDYMHCLVPDQRGIMNLTFYWGNIDRCEADKILHNKPEGTFLLRDSSQEKILFSVSYRRYGFTLHARIQQWKHKFSFVPYYYYYNTRYYSCDTISGLLGHYNTDYMWFEPMLTIPFPRTNPPSLQQLTRSVICTQTTYDDTNILELPRFMKDYLQEYHYTQRV